MKKVGIVSCYFKNNYGSILQSYATKRFLDNNGIDNETISIVDNKDFKKGKKKYYLSQLFNFNFIKTKFGMIKLKIYKKINRKLEKNIKIRTDKYKEFRENINLSRSCIDYKGLTQLAKDEYSDVIVGSDQLWLPVNVVSDYYTLNWVPKNTNKISYSTSFGVSTIPNKYIKKYREFLRRINFLSVREETGVNLIKNISGLDAKLVCDPTMLLSKEDWDEIATKERIIKEKYILCYFLGKNIEHRKFAERLKEKTGYKIVSLNHADEYVKYSDIFADIVPYDIGPKEWLNLVKNAEYVCTDSFHGTVFSLIYNKIFFNFRRYNSKNKNSTNSRLDSLLKKVGLTNERILTGNETIEEILKLNIDYNIVNEKIDEFRNNSKKWLLNSITWKNENENKNKAIDIENQSYCTGCTACKNVCPQKAIEMRQDKNGFIYPVIDYKKCVNCGLCKKICPVLNKKANEKIKQKGYIFQNGNSKIRLESTSGGFFSAIAEYVIEKKGIVYGAAFDENFIVKHIRINKKEDIKKFRNSKYVQSDVNDTFVKVKKDLEENRVVCYSGTACQIEGLKSFLQKEYDNLITVDVICRAVPSPKLWEKYLEFQRKDNKITDVKFREKIYGYKYSNLTIRKDDKILYKNGIDTDPYLRAFFSNIACRLSCYDCKFKEQYHKADFTIWDCFDVEKYSKEFDDDKGTTRVLVNSLKGLQVFEELIPVNKVQEVEVDDLVSNFHQMFNSIKYNSKREDFFEDLNNIEFNNLINKYFPNKFKNKIEKNIRLILLKLRIYKPLISIGKKIRKRV